MKEIIKYMLSLKNEYKLCEFFAILFLIDIEAKKVLGKTIISDKWKFEYCWLYNYDICNLLGNDEDFMIIENQEELVFSWPLTRTNVKLKDNSYNKELFDNKEYLKVINKVLKKIQGKDISSILKSIFDSDNFKNIKMGEKIFYQK